MGRDLKTDIKTLIDNATFSDFINTFELVNGDFYSDSLQVKIKKQVVEFLKEKLGGSDIKITITRMRSHMLYILCKNATDQSKSHPLYTLSPITGDFLSRY